MYRITSNGVIRLVDGAFIPSNSENADWLAYLDWVSQGNEAEPEQIVSGVPSEVTQRQARMALHSLGHLTSVEAAINALPDPPRTEARIAWDFSNTIQRSNPFVSQLAALLGFTEQDLDELFIMAAGL